MGEFKSSVAVHISVCAVLCVNSVVLRTVQILCFFGDHIAFCVCIIMPKRKHMQLSIKQKLEIIEKLEKGVKPAMISAEYGIAKQTISDIRKSKEKLVKYASESECDKASTSYKRAGLERTRVQHGRSEKLKSSYEVDSATAWGRCFCSVC